MQKILKSPIFWVVGAAVGLWAISRMSLGQKTNFLLRSVRPGGTVFQPQILVELTIQNPTSQSATLKSLTGNVYINDRYLGNVSAFGDQVIQPNSENIVTLTARPSALGVIAALRELLTAPAGTNVISFTGTANVDGFTVPINERKTV
jgi:LEA14-like dessication related protein